MTQTATFPAGYGSDTDTMTEVRGKHKARYHPEAWRRIEAIMVASKGLLGLADHHGLCGIGGGARTREEQAASYKRSPGTFAPPDSSFHQVWEWADGESGAQAVDWVGRDGRHTEAWTFLREHGGLYGLLTFWNVNGEPWHTQMVDVPNSVSKWKALGKPGPGRWNLPGSADVPDKPDDESYGLYPWNKTKPTIGQGARGDLVLYLQRVLANRAGQQIAQDGEFGPATAAAVQNLQAFVKLKATGNVDQATWDIVDVLAGYVAPPVPVDPVGVPADVEMVNFGLYYVRPGDGPWAAAQRIFGNGADWARHFTVDLFAVPHVPVRVEGMTGRTTTVRAGEGQYAIIHRMFPDANQYALLDRFSVFNGGSSRVLQPGDVVFLDTP